jgi:glycosyltransferase involved in cell wall biosynthesis
MYNESKTIERTIRGLTEIAKGLLNDYEIIIADDASSDESASIVDRIAGKDPRIRITRLQKNTKFGGALRKGIENARKDIIIYTDSDLPIGAENVREALRLLDKSDIVTAYSRVHKGETVKRKVISKVYNFLIQLLFRTSLKDINSGFKIYKRKIFNGMELISESPFVDVEIFVKAMRKGFTVEQYPVIFKERKGGKSYISRPGVILRTFLDMIRFRLGV